MTEIQMRNAMEANEKRYAALVARVELLELAVAEHVRPAKKTSHPAPSSSYPEKKTP